MRKIFARRFQRKTVLLLVRKIHIAFLVFLLCAFLLTATVIVCTKGLHTDGTPQTSKLAIIIDDFGLQRKGVQEMLELDCKLTAAIMPFLDYSEEDAVLAVEHGKEVILHLPMQATLHDNWNHIGPRPFRLGQSKEEICQLLGEMLEDIPQAKGANIHMGTLCSTKEEIMLPIFQCIRERGLYFVDSMTSAKSVCASVAEETGIEFYENGVFLEHEQKTKTYVKKRLAKAMKIAMNKGSCIAIGHVGAEGGMITVEAIREMQPIFSENGVELVWVSELKEKKNHRNE